LDLDGDGTDERIAAYFSCSWTYDDGSVPVDTFDLCEIEVAARGGMVYTASWQYDNLRPRLNFADFDAGDGLIQIYLEGDGPSGDPYTRIFGCDGTRVIKNAGFPGFITRCDGHGRIYSFDEYNVNCFYDLRNGLTPLPKENIVGTETERNF